MSSRRTTLSFSSAPPEFTNEQKIFFNCAIEAAAVEAEQYPRTSSVGKPLAGVAIAAVIRKLKK